MVSRHNLIMSGCILVILFISIMNCSSCNKEYFNKNKRGKKRVVFGVPQLSTSADSKGIKKLLEMGTQADENTKYDTVATKYL